MESTQEQHATSSMFQTIFKEAIEEHKLVVDEPTIIEGSVDQPPQTMDIRSVHAIFKKLEEHFERRLSDMENKRSHDKDVVNKEEHDKVCLEMKKS